jgi:hypothetical protein
MATNLRLDERAAAALRAAARATGRSQQELLREAVDRYLGLRATSDRERAVASGLVEDPSPLVDFAAGIALPAGVGVLDLLDRDDSR